MKPLKLHPWIISDSQRLFEKAQHFIPGGVPSTGLCFRAVGDPFIYKKG